MIYATNCPKWLSNSTIRLIFMVFPQCAELFSHLTCHMIFNQVKLKWAMIESNFQSQNCPGLILNHSMLKVCICILWFYIKRKVTSLTFHSKQSTLTDHSHVKGHYVISYIWDFEYIWIFTRWNFPRQSQYYTHTKLIMFSSAALWIPASLSYSKIVRENAQLLCQWNITMSG